MPDNEIVLPDMDAWQDFAAANREALLEDHASISDAYVLCSLGELRMGGGAAPLITVRFKRS